MKATEILSDTKHPVSPAIQAHLNEVLSRPYKPQANKDAIHPPGWYIKDGLWTQDEHVKSEPLKDNCRVKPLVHLQNGSPVFIGDPTDSMSHNEWMALRREQLKQEPFIPDPPSRYHGLAECMKD
jgi:hypothetical protein